LSATATPQTGPSMRAADAEVASPAAVRRWSPWLAVALAALVAWAALTWPLAIHFDHVWTMKGNRSVATEPNFVTRPGALASGDWLQNVFIESVVVDNLRELRDPFLDLREGAAGPAPLRTTSLDVPWTLLLGLLWPLTGLLPAYNATLLVSTLLTALVTFGWLRRHTRWPLLAAAGALAYTFTPNHLFQLTSHFNAVMWWAFPAAAWAFEAAVERHREGGRWRRPVLALAAVVLLVGLSGEYHLDLYLAGLLVFLVAWALLSAALRRRPLPWGPALTTVAAVAVSAGYVLAAFQFAFKGTVAGENGSWSQVVLYAPTSVWALVRKSFGTQGEGLIYVGWPLLLLAALGLLLTLALARRRERALPYAVLVLPLLMLTYGPRADVGSFRPYRFLFDHLPFLSLQRVPERLMVVTALVLVLLAVVALDAVAGLVPRVLRAATARRLGAVALLLATVLLLVDYRVSESRLQPGLADNRVVAALRAAGDGAGPILGVPVLGPGVTWNSATTYLAAQSRRRSLNAYNQTPVPWLTERLARLEPLNRGSADPAVLDLLAATGTTQVVVIDEPRVFGPNQWQATIDALLASGHFRLVTRDPPLALLERTG
jgi:hypothetical protein